MLGDGAGCGKVGRGLPGVAGFIIRGEKQVGVMSCPPLSPE